jgi:hypothetical protein
MPAMPKRGMTTDALVESLVSRSAEPMSYAPRPMLAMATSAALASSVLLSMIWLKPRPDFSFELAVRNGVFALKIVFAVGVVWAALLLLRRLSVPGRNIEGTARIVGIPFVAVAAAGLLELVFANSLPWGHHPGHGSWLECLWEIPILGLPALVLLMMSLRRLAPTRLRLSGCAVGLLSGGIGAFGYALHCGDDSASFVAAAYTAAIGEMAILGALLGPRLLRWH